MAVSVIVRMTVMVVVLVAVRVIVSMVMIVIMPAAARVTMVVIMLRLVMVCAANVQVVVTALAMIVAVIVCVTMALVRAALGLERASDAGRSTAEAADHLGEHVVVFDVDRVGRDLGRGVAVTDVPGDLGEPGRRLSSDLQQRLRGGSDLDQPAVLEPEGVAALGGRRLVEIEQKFKAAVGLQSHAPTVAALVVEGDRVDDPLRLDGELADDGSGADHQEPRASDGWTLPRPARDRKTTFRLAPGAGQAAVWRATRATTTMAANDARPETRASASAVLRPASRAAANTTGARPKAMFWASISRPLALP